MSASKFYQHVYDLIEKKDAIEIAAQQLMRDISDMRDNEPWVSAGTINDATKFVEKLDGVWNGFEDLLLTDETARMAIEYAENGYIDEDAA